jgi:hypothetical protein
MERLQDEWLYWYRATPVGYPISDNNRPATYDQFISLRDTLIYSNKYYGSSAWRSLIIWTKLDWTPTNTIEIWEPNIMHMSVEPSWSTNRWQSKWEYVTPWWHTWYIACDIVKKWRYRLQHKEQFNNISSDITRIHSYILQHKSDWTTVDRAVFDWEWNTWWEILRMTAFGYIECDLDKWDWLELKVEDQSWNDITSEMANNSNRRMVEYIDLAYNI